MGGAIKGFKKAVSDEDEAAKQTAQEQSKLENAQQAGNIYDAKATEKTPADSADNKPKA